jgi:GDP-mannose 6-dehydrogenase
MGATAVSQGFFERESRPYRPRRPPAISIVGLCRDGFRQLALFARRGHRVVAVDGRPHVVAEVNLGRSGLGDESVDRALTDAVVGGRATAVGSALGAIVDTDATFFTQVNPADGAKAWMAVARTAGIALRARRGYHLFVLVGQLPSGMARRKLLPEIERLSGKRVGRDFGLCIRLDQPDCEEIVLGVSDEQAGEHFLELHEGLDVRVRRMSLDEAEALSTPSAH